eukprot:gene2986-3432_t
MILIVDDDIAVRTSLSLLLESEGWKTLQADRAGDALDIIQGQLPELIILDLNFSMSTSGKEGMDLLAQIRKINSRVPVILITGWASIELAVQGMKLGANDFINKPWNNTHILQSVKTLLQLGTERKENRTRKQLDARYEFKQIIGEDPRMLEIMDTIGRVASTGASVLIMGESGTGKELIAEAVHENSSRSNKAFIKVNLGVLGSSKAKTVDARVVCATNKNLNEMVQQGLFREDLLYRINLITIQLPPLRERPGDIPLLVNFFISNLKEIYHRPRLSVSAGAMKWLQKLQLPGNIRQLKNLVERSILVSKKDELEIEDFMAQLDTVPGKKETGQLPEVGAMTLEQVETEMVKRAMAFHKNRISKAAASLGITRNSLYRRLEKYQIPFNESED